MKITEITIEMLTKNIIATYVDDVTGYQSKRGFNPLIDQDWNDIESESNLLLYKNIAWNGLSRPEIMGEIIIVDEHE